MAEAPNSHLRNRPRQARSAARVELLLDVAAEVFEEVGYDAATTNLVAARADVPVGTLYRWFPDKAALAEALTDRYLAHLVDLYADLLSDIGPGERIGDFVHRVLDRLVKETRGQRALPALLVSAMVPGGRSNAGERLRAGLAGHVRALVELRVPGLPEPIVERTSEVMVTLAHLVLAAAANEADPDREVMTAEYADVMLAYLEAKFPAADSPAWTDPDVPVKPVFPAPQRDARLATSGD
ncbi:MAG: regulatory protein TetR [Acidimicrobiales bacterium]|nr:regulatory protein TetR [Acidimicrobiales bacterium]